MKKTIIIPSRYGSSRLPGKGLINICGRPIIWWVYNQCFKCKNIDDIFLAIDHPKSEEVCKEYNLPYIMTSENCPSHILRIWEASEKIKSDLYIEVCGDEPIIEPKVIDQMALHPFESDAEYFLQAYSDITNPVDSYDSSIIKLVTNIQNNVIYYSRSPIPYPKDNKEFTLKKSVGVHAFTKKSLDFIKNHPEIGPLEKIEGIDELRFIEYGHRVHGIRIESKSKSVDTKKDLIYVEKILSSIN